MNVVCVFLISYFLFPLVSYSLGKVKKIDTELMLKDHLDITYRPFFTEEREIITINRTQKISNYRDYELFWFIKRSPVKAYQLLGENKYPSIRMKYREHQVIQEEPIIVGGKYKSSIYNPKDYPRYNPKISFRKELSLGERERIKKSLIIIKIVLHTDRFLEILKQHKSIFSIERYYEKYLDKKKVNIERHLKSIINKNPLDIYNLIMDGSYEIIFMKLPGDFIPDRIIAEAIFGISTNEHFSGFIRMYNQGKGLNYYTYMLPVIIFHESLHILGYRHIIEEEFEEIKDMSRFNVPYDLVNVLSINNFAHLYFNLDFPKIPYNCYKGLTNKWNQC